MSKPFYNSINASGQTLMRFEGKALSQQELVLAVFRSHSYPLAWHEVKSLLKQPMNDCSIKRSITNLKTLQLISKTHEMIQGIAGKQVHKYKINK